MRKAYFGLLFLLIYDFACAQSISSTVDSFPLINAGSLNLFARPSSPITIIFDRRFASENLSELLIRL